MALEKKNISIFIPCFNEIETIQKSIDQALKLKIFQKEIIIIDNGSTDGSQKVINKYKNKKNFRIILRDRNLGYGSSVKQALKISTSKYIYIHFSDCEYDIRTAIKMYSLAESKKLDVVFGSRLKNFSLIKKVTLLKDKPSYLGTFVITGLYNLLYATNFTDVIGSKFYKINSVKKIKIKSNHFRYDFKLKSKIIKNKLKIEEVFTKYKPRVDSTKKNVKFYHLFPAIYEILKNKLID